MGYIWAREFNTDNTIKIKETLELTTFFIASEMSNYLLVKRMEVLSSVDLLTGINNRNTMNNRVDRIVAGKEILAEPYAVIFADLNGLKRVNDTEGHTAGDEMIKEAATKNVSLSAGVSLSSEEPNILKAMRTADTRMYADKEAYYAEHPEFKYR